MAYVDENKLERLNAFINASPTIAERAGTELAGLAHKTVMYDDNGDVVIATSGDKAIGLVLSDTLDPVPKGRDVNILVKYIGLGEAGAEVKKGDLLTVNATGQVIPATSGSFIFGRAFSAATEAGESVHVQINPMGAMA